MEIEKLHYNLEVNGVNSYSKKRLKELKKEVEKSRENILSELSYLQELKFDLEACDKILLDINKELKKKRR